MSIPRVTSHKLGDLEKKNKPMKKPGSSCSPCLSGLEQMKDVLFMGNSIKQRYNGYSVCKTPDTLQNHFNLWGWNVSW